MIPMICRGLWWVAFGTVFAAFAAAIAVETGNALTERSVPASADAAPSLVGRTVVRVVFCGRRVAVHLDDGTVLTATRPAWVTPPETP